MPLLHMPQIGPGVGQDRKLLCEYVKGDIAGVFRCSACRHYFSGDAWDALCAFNTHSCMRPTIALADQASAARMEQSTAMATRRIFAAVQSFMGRLQRKRKRISVASS
jgi:hypothetical protein